MLRSVARSLSVLWAIAALSACGLPTEPTPGAAPFAPASSPGAERSDALIYAGEGTWAPEINSITNLLYTRGTTYRSVSSKELDAMPLEEIAKYAVLIVPGGDAPAATSSLARETHAKIRAAVRERGVSYLGFCAGAWMAVGPSENPGGSFSFSLSIVDGPIQDKSPLAREGRQFLLSEASFADGTRRKLLWYGGPKTPDVPGGVFARYSDGSPAITQMKSGAGLVTVSGFHPAATKPMLDALGLEAGEAVAPEIAWKMIESSIQRRPLPAY